jgi:hypothetical protein
MYKSIVFSVFLSPLEIELHNEVGDERTARDEALRMIKNGEVEIDDVDFCEERDCECGCND